MSAEKKDFQYIVRVIGTDLDGKKPVIIGLSKIKGINDVFANAVVKITGIPEDKKIGELSEKEIKNIEEVVKNPIKKGIPSFLVNRRKDYSTGKNKHIVGNDVELQINHDIRRMKSISSYKGIRHSRNLTVRGQRTRSGYTRPPERKHRRGGAVARTKRKVVRK